MANRKYQFLAAIGIALGLFSAPPAQAHSHLVGQFQPRNPSSGIKTGPCGGDPRGTNPQVVQAGATVTVQWEETIHHTGRFEFYFATANDANLFTPTETAPNLIFKIDNNQNDANVPHEYSAQITMPNTPCDACTLQLIQVMLDNHPTMPTYYYSCADVRLTAPPTPVATPAPTPIPVATPGCAPKP